MEAVAEPVVLTPIRVRLPDLPSIGEEELSQAVVRGFVTALHSSRERADQVVAREVEEEASFAAREFLSNGVVGDREGVERPLALLGTLYRLLGCKVSAWLETPGWGILLVEDCPVRRSLALVGIDCRAVCSKMKRGALEALPEQVSSSRMPGGHGCTHLLKMDGNGG